MSIVLGTPASSSSSTRLVNSIPHGFVSSLCAALPIGNEALLLLGGKAKEQVKTKGASNEFPDDRIVIPVGITPQNLKYYTLYDILGFGGEWGASADTEAIRKAYHKAVLMYHPDKAQYKTADGKEDRTVFLKIQEAFNVLSNESKRRAYDSQLPFDESIPSEEKIQKALAKGPHKFFKLFNPVFQRNARFAVQKPVPDLGDMETPITQVYKFYEYWVKFESWRDFTGVGAEHKPDDAQSREEKRWMQKENDRIAKKLKKKEMERLISLVALAEKFDPRIVADKDKRKQGKEAEKNAKEAIAKKFAEEDVASKAWSEQLELEATAKKGATKEDREKLKKAQSKARNILRKLLRHSATLGLGSGEYGIISATDVELICTNCSLEDVNDMNNAMGGEGASKEASLVQQGGFEVVKEKLAAVLVINEQTVEDEKIAKEAKKREADEKNAPRKKHQNNANTADLERTWSEDALIVLEKCIARYPAGTPNRWITICNYMNVITQPSDSYNPDECLRAAYRITFNIPHSI
eukprot:gene15093-20310_t